MSRYAHFPNIKSGVAFSDPWYKEDAWCQYRKAFQSSNWYMKLDANDSYPGCTDIVAVFGCPIIAGNVDITRDAEGFAYKHPAHYTTECVELGIDSAKIFFGSLKDFREFGESAALHTGGDGLCGDLITFTVKGDSKPSGFIIAVSFGEDFVNVDSFFQQMVSSFEGKEISREQFMKGVDPQSITNKVLLANELRIAKQNAEKETQKPEREHNPPER